MYSILLRCGDLWFFFRSVLLKCRARSRLSVLPYVPAFGVQTPGMIFSAFAVQATWAAWVTWEAFEKVFSHFVSIFEVSFLCGLHKEYLQLVINEGKY